jgi:hypothetical protein
VRTEKKKKKSFVGCTLTVKGEKPSRSITEKMPEAAVCPARTRPIIDLCELTE